MDGHDCTESKKKAENKDETGATSKKDVDLICTGQSGAGNNNEAKGGGKAGDSLFDHPVYKRISKVNGVINRMQRNEIVDKLAELNLNQKGTKEVLQKRLKGWVKYRNLQEAKVEEDVKSKWFTDYYVVIDFEATCDEQNPPEFVHEIIEFPAVLLNAKTLHVESEFHSYCRPKLHPILTPFCKKLTGIQQYKVDSAPEFPTVLKRFDQWLKQELRPTDHFAVLTDGPWDVNRFLKIQCKLCELEMPHYTERWVNIRKHFGNFYRLHRSNLDDMLQHLGMEFEGRPHSGIDDARNIARVAIQVIKDGCELSINDCVR